MYFRYSLLSAFGEGRGPSFEQTWISFTQWCFVSSLVETGHVVLEKKTFKISIIFSLFRYYLHLEKGVVLRLNKLEFPSKGCFVSSLVEIGPLVQEKKKMWEVYNNDNKNDIDRQRTNCSLLLSMCFILKHVINFCPHLPIP